jgi:type IV fimbrial biogenesis protein FimT
MKCRECDGRLAVGMSPGKSRVKSAGAAARRVGHGFSAIELLIALSIAGVLVSLAVPGFAVLMRSAGLSAAANELLAALHTARSSAVLRGLPVAVCLTADDRTCVASSDSGASGWLVFVADGAAAASKPTAVGEVLTSFRLPDRLTVSASRPTVTFWPVTRAAATSTFDLCDLEGAGRSIVVSQTGRPRVAAEATSCA